MSSVAEKVEAVGDWHLRGRDLDQIFATDGLSDAALTAACLTTARFDPSFPGWELYRRITSGWRMFDAELIAWATSTAWLLANSRRKKTGRKYIEAQGPWITQAAHDALDAVVYGYPPSPAYQRAQAAGIKSETWNKIFRPMAAAIAIGFETFRAELNANYRRVRIVEALDLGSKVMLRGDTRHLWYGPQVGNYWINPASNPDDSLAD